MTLVDVKNILLSLDEDHSASEPGEGESRQHGSTAHMQISHADVIIINKCESVSSQRLGEVEDRIRSINGLARIHRTSYSEVPDLDGYLLDLHAYDGVQSLDVSRTKHSHLDPVCIDVSIWLVFSAADQ